RTWPLCQVVRSILWGDPFRKTVSPGSKRSGKSVRGRTLRPPLTPCVPTICPTRTCGSGPGMLVFGLDLDHGALVGLGTGGRDELADTGDHPAVFSDHAADVVWSDLDRENTGATVVDLVYGHRIGLEDGQFDDVLDERG